MVAIEVSSFLFNNMFYNLQNSSDTELAGAN